MPPIGSKIDKALLRKGDYRYLGGISGTVSVPAGSSIISWSAFATASGATVTVDGGNAIPVPVNGFVSSENLEVLNASVNFAFSGTAGYFIEYT